MNCERAMEWMMAALDGELEPGRRASLEDHLAHCAACRAEWEHLQAVERVLREAPMVRPSAGFAGRVLARLDRRRRVRRALLGGAALVAGAAALFLLSLAPTAWFLSKPAGVLAVARTEGLLLGRLADAACTLLDSLLLTAGVLAPVAASLGLCGLVSAAFVGLAWLGLLWRLQPVVVARR